MDNKLEFFGKRLAERRREKNFTQEELANRLGVTPQALSKWEKGTSSPDVIILTALAEMLNASTDYLLGARENKITEDGDARISEQIWSNLRNGLESVELIIGEALIPLFIDNRFVEKIVNLRVQLSKEGILMPIVRIRDELCLKSNEFAILAYQKVLYCEAIEVVEKPETIETTEDIDGTEGIENVDDKQLDYIIATLESTVRNKYAEILNADLLKKLVDNLKINYPALIEGVIPERISYGLLLEVVKGFLNRGNGMIYLPKIIEIMERLQREQAYTTTAEFVKAICGDLEREDNLYVFLAKRNLG